MAGRSTWGRPSTAYDVATGTVIFKRPQIKTWLPLDLSPDGTLLATPAVNAEGTPTDLVLVDTRTGRIVHRLENHSQLIVGVAFSPDGRLVAANSLDRTTIVWKVKSGAVSQRLDTGSTAGIAFSSDSSRLYLSGENEAVSTWDLTGRDRFLTPVRMGPNFSVTGGFLRPSPQGTRLAYYYTKNGIENRIDFVDVAAGKTSGRWDERFVLVRARIVESGRQHLCHG